MGRLPEGAERRLHPRSEFLLKVHYERPKDVLPDYITDLAMGGAFICTPLEFKTNDNVRFSISFPGLIDPIDLDAVVRWHRPADPETNAGIGVEFVYSSDDQKGLVRDLLDRLNVPVPTQRADHPFRLFLVEDNDFAQRLFRHAVKRFHKEAQAEDLIDVVSAHTGDQALELLKQEPRFDLAIIDHFLPVLTGASLIRELRTMGPHRETPVLVISIGGEGVREEILSAGADLYLDKPVILKQLINTLRILFTTQRMQADSQS